MKKNKLKKNKKVYFKKNFFEKLYLIFITIFLFFLPTQLGKHFFPNFSYLNGIRVDYLSPTFYLTDIFIFVFFILNFQKIFDFFKNKKIIIFFILLLINIFFAKNKIIAFYQVFQIFKLLIVFFIGKNIFKIINEKIFLIVVFFSGLFQLVLSTLQLNFKSSIQGVFYFFGERLFNLSTPGIAKGSINGIEFLRPYGTFSHPNSMAGFFLLLYFFILSWKNFNKHIFLKYLNLFIFSCLIFISFSKTAIISFLIINIFYYFKNRRFTKNCYLCFFSKIFVLLIISLIFLQARTDSLTVNKRVELIKNSTEIIFKNPIFGVGIGNYLIAQSRFFSRYFLFFNQPVHNIFLLFFSEFGLVLGGLIIILFFSEIKNLVKANIFLFLAVFFTGFFDHYWMTLEQNRLLAFFIYGIVSSSFLIFRFNSKS